MLKTALLLRLATRVYRSGNRSVNSVEMVGHSTDLGTGPGRFSIEPAFDSWNFVTAFANPSIDSRVSNIVWLKLRKVSIAPTNSGDALPDVASWKVTKNSRLSSVFDNTSAYPSFARPTSALNVANLGLNAGIWTEQQMPSTSLDSHLPL